MTTTCLPSRMQLLALLMAFGALGLSGCHSLDLYQQPFGEPIAPELEPPREKSLVSLPAYRIAPPDILSIEMLRQVPLPPYRAEPYDVLNIEVMGALPDQPIGFTYMNGRPMRIPYLVEPEGTVDLGPAYGRVRVIGMTLDEIRESITRQLRQILASPVVSVSLARSAGTQPITAEYNVGPDGTVNLGQYGSVHVAGKTIAEAKAAIEQHLSHHFDSPEVSVQVIAYLSKVYYIITEGGLGDSIVRVPITGKETVLDAISNVGGLSQLSSKEIWIARPAPSGFGCEQVLPIDYIAITRGASTDTNYQLMPGDRVFIADDDTLALTNVIGIMTGPIERAVGITSFVNSTIRGLQTLGRAYNQRSGF